jgi:hypothetical protein
VTTVELVVTVLEVLTIDVVKLVEGDTELAITGSAVVLSTMPTTRNPSDPMTTERRGARVDARLESIRFFCPCVKFNMHQLSETHSKLPPTTAQHPLNSERPFRDIAARTGIYYDKAMPSSATTNTTHDFVVTEQSRWRTCLT